MRVYRRAVIAAIALSWAAGFDAAQAAVRLRLSHHHAVGGHLDQTARKFKELVETATKGEVTVQIFPAGQLAQEREGIDQLDQGVLDMTITSVALIDKHWKPIQITSLPFVWKSWDAADRAVDGEVGKFIVEGVARNSDVQILGIIGGGFRDMIFRGDPVTSVEGMSGLRMRSPEAHLWIRMFELLKARPTPVTWGEIYTAMMTGVAAGLEAPPLSVTDAKLHEVMKSAVLTQHMFLTYALNINKKKFQSLSPDLQKAVAEAARQTASWSNQYAKDANEKAYDQMRRAGVKIVEPQDRNAWAAAMRPLWDEMAKDPESQRLLAMITAIQ
jgi:tripartite ATP-independent transporter DctP family solute receptor